MTSKIVRLTLLLVLAASLLTVGGEALAALQDKGSLNFAGFPMWYRDTNGVAVQQCLSTTISPDLTLPAGSLMCGVTMTLNEAQNPPFDPAQPITFPPSPPTDFNWPGEAFYFQAANDPDFQVAGSQSTLVEFGLESTFGLGDPAPGDQIVFTRVRIDLDGMPVSGTYTVFHPFGTDSLVIDIADPKTFRITRDIGATGIPFVGALNGDLGPFLHWDFDSTYGTNGDGTITVGEETFLGDPNIPHTFVGGPALADNNNQPRNFIRIEGPEGADLDGQGNNFIQSDKLLIEGLMFTVLIPSQVDVKRATYSRTTTGGQLDVFASTSVLSNQSTPSSLEISYPGRRSIADDQQDCSGR